MHDDPKAKEHMVYFTKKEASFAGVQGLRQEVLRAEAREIGRSWTMKDLGLWR